MPPKKETLEIGMTSFRLFLWKSKNEWLVWSLAKTVPLPNGPSPLHGRFELSIAPMNNYGHALKLFLCSATIAVWSGQFYQVILLHTIDMYTRIGGVSLLNQTIPTNFSIISTLNWWSVSMRGVFLSTTRVLFLAPFQLENRLAPSFVYLWHTLNIYWRAVGVFLTSKSALTVGKPR